MTTIRSLSALVLASFLAACANMSSLPPAPDKAPKHNYVYQIGPGDELDLKVWRNPDLSVKVPVRPDGKITAPLIKDIVAVGKTPQVPYQNGITPLDVMTKANGLTRKAAGNQAILIRAIENNKQYRVRLEDLLKRGDPSANVEIAPGDSIMIPESLL